MMYQPGLYWQFLGWAELLAGLLLLTQRFALLGALAYVSIMANIFVITNSYDFGGTPVITGLLLLAWNRLRVVLNQPAVPEATSLLFASRWWEVVGVVLSAFTAGYRALTDQYNFLLWFGICGLIGAVGLLGAGRRYFRQSRVLVN